MPIPFDQTADRMMHAARLKNHSALARDLGITPQALSNYKKRGEFPAHLVVEFALGHSLSIDDLLGNTVQVAEDDLPGAANLTINGLNPDESAYVIKALKVLRSPDTTLAEVFRHSLDALVEGQAKGPLHV